MTENTATAPEPELESVDPNDLEPHEVNDQIYNNRELDDDFVESIEKNGVLEPVVVKEESGRTIISGHRRVKAARQVGLDAVPVRTVEFDSRPDEIQALVDFNRQRDKTKGEKIREGKWYLEAKKQKNREKMEQAGREHGRGQPSSGEKGSPRGENANNSDSYKEAAETVGVGKNSLSRGVNVLETAEDEDDEDVREVAEQEMEKLDEDQQSYRGASENVEAARKLREKVENGDDIESDVAAKAIEQVKNGSVEARYALDEAKKEIRKRRHRNLLDQTESDDVMAQQFDVIVADAPWDYDSVGWRVTNHAEHPYPTMSLDELKDIKVPSAENSVLWLWFPNPLVREACELAGSWGFDQKTIITWDKERYGPRLWLRNRTEHVLFCIRGVPDLNIDSHPTIIRGPSASHSTKPESFYEIVEDGCPGTKLELFATQAQDGWTALGEELSPDESDNRVESGVAEGEPSYGTSETQLIQSKADIVLEYPEGRFALEDIDNDVLRGYIKELHHNKILVKISERTVVDSDFDAEGNHVEKTRYQVNEFKVTDKARDIAREVVQNREFELPCGHAGIRNCGDHIECSNPICDAQYDRAELEGI